MTESSGEISTLLDNLLNTHLSSKTDKTLNGSSSNPVANSAVSTAIDSCAKSESLATVATSGSYSDLKNAPSLANVATSGKYSDLSDTPSLSTVATSGSYNDLSNKPTIDTALSATSTNAVQNKIVKSALDAKVAKAGDTMTGTLTVAQSKNSIDGGVATGMIQINANGNSGGGQIRLHGKSHSTNAGEVIIYVNNGTDSEKSLVMKPSGVMTWCGNELVPIQNNAAAHNSIYRGIDLTTKYTEAQISAKIQANDFSDLFIGDYIPKTLTIDGTSVTANWVIAHFDYYRRMGWTADGLSTGFEVNVPHVVLVPDRNLLNAQMNSTNTTEGGYLGSAMHTTTMPKISTALQNGFGADHVISFASYLSSTVNTSLASMAGCGWTGAVTAWGCTWTKVQCRLMSEQMVYGSAIMSSSGFDAGEAKQQLALFALHPQATNIRANWWMSAVASSTRFANVDDVGDAGAGHASVSRGVRPFFLYH